MSYHQPPQGPPPQGYGYQQPPPQQFQGYPQQGGYPPPQQQQWGPPPPGQFHQQGPPPPQQWQQPPNQQFHQSGPPPPQQQGYPPQQQGYPPQQQGYPPQQYGPPTPASPGYDPRITAQGNPIADVKALRKAMERLGTDEKTLITILTKPDPLQMALLRNAYLQDRQGKKTLEAEVSSELSGKLKEGMVALVRGPLMADAHDVHGAIKGIGTKESTLNDVLCGRSNADMKAIKHAYFETFKKTMESDVKGDLSLKTEQLFDMIMSATRNEESTPVTQQQVEQDIAQLHGAMGGRMGTDEIAVCSLLVNRSDTQLRAIDHAFKQRYQRSLQDNIRSEFSGHMRDALLLIVRRAADRAMTDAEQLEDSMAGMGTKDTLLIQRVVRVHWDRAHKDQVKRAYQHRYKKDLINRIKGETSGDYERMLVACMQ